MNGREKKERGNKTGDGKREVRNNSEQIKCYKINNLTKKPPGKQGNSHISEKYKKGTETFRKQVREVLIPPLGQFPVSQAAKTLGVFQQVSKCEHIENGDETEQSSPQCIRDPSGSPEKPSAYGFQTMTNRFIMP